MFKQTSSIIKGIHYQNKFVHECLTRLKLLNQFNLRYKIASTYIRDGDSILDVGGGYGGLRDYLKCNCNYTCIEASDGFIRILKKKNYKYIDIDLHNTFPDEKEIFDIVVMIISLYQFRATSVNHLLRKFKKIGKKILIIEEVIKDSTSKKRKFLDNFMNYLSATNYYTSTSPYSQDEFRSLLRSYDYDVKKYNNRYMVAYYES